MIDKHHFTQLEDNFGKWASWAVWAEPEDAPISEDPPRTSKNNIGSIDFFKDDSRLAILKPEYVLLGLNWSRKPNIVHWTNFHDPRPEAQDYKLRYALLDTRLWGAYMTDLVKNCVQLDAGKVKPNDDDYVSLKKELKSLTEKNSKPLTVIALGNKVHVYLSKKQEDLEKEFPGCRIEKLVHYAARISPIQYRCEVKKLCLRIAEHES